MDDTPQTNSERALAHVEKPLPKLVTALHSTATVTGDGEIKENFESAFQAVQKELGGVMEAKATNPFKSYKYISLGALLAQLMASMHRNGLTLRQYPGDLTYRGESAHRVYLIEVITKITHSETGEYELFSFPIPIEPHSYKDSEKNWVFTNKIVPQDTGAAFTYGRRYALLSYFGIAGAADEEFSKIETDLSDSEAEIMITDMKEEMAQQETLESLDAWSETMAAAIHLMPQKVQQALRDNYAEMKNKFEVEEAKKPKRKTPAKK